MDPQARLTVQSQSYVSSAVEWRHVWQQGGGEVCCDGRLVFPRV